MQDTMLLGANGVWTDQPVQAPMTQARIRSSGARHTVVRVTYRFNASPKRVFDAWLDPKVAGEWLFATALRPMTPVAIDARVGGSFHFVDGWDGEDVAYTGEYLEIVPHRRLAFTLSGENPLVPAARVIVRITRVGNRSCELRLRHENVAPEDANYTETRWIGILYGLQETLLSRAGRAKSD